MGEKYWRSRPTSESWRRWHAEARRKKGRSDVPCTHTHTSSQVCLSLTASVKLIIVFKGGKGLDQQTPGTPLHSPPQCVSLSGSASDCFRLLFPTLLGGREGGGATRPLALLSSILSPHPPPRRFHTKNILRPSDPSIYRCTILLPPPLFETPNSGSSSCCLLKGRRQTAQLSTEPPRVRKGRRGEAAPGWRLTDQPNQ